MTDTPKEKALPPLIVYADDARITKTLRTIDGLRSSLFTYSDFEMNLGLQVAEGRITSAVRELERALRDADLRIEKARESLADHPRHYGISE